MSRPAPTSWRHVLVLSYLALVAFCSLELVPGWEPIEFGLSAIRHYWILGIAGLIVGGLMSERFWLPGIIAGPLIGIGGLATVLWHLTLVPATNSVFVFLVAMIGTIPGWTLFVVLRLWQARLSGSAEAPPSSELRAARQ